MGENVTFKIKKKIGVIEVDRPKALNALNAATLREISSLLRDIRAKKEIGGLIVTGAGEKAFVAGADIAAMVEMDTQECGEFSRLGQQVLRRLELLPIPTVAAVNGFALGGGLELALACDIILASEKARLGLPEVTLGIIPGFGGTQRLAKAVGPWKAREIIFTGEMIGAAEALHIGLVNRVLEPGKLMEGAEKILGKIMSAGPVAVRCAKEAIGGGIGLGVDEGHLVERAQFGLACASEDRIEGMRAFLGKRSPEFKGK